MVPVGQKAQALSHIDRLVPYTPTPMKRPLRLIVNPASGRGQTQSLVPHFAEQLAAGFDPVEVSLTRSLDHARELAQEAVATGHLAVAVGGDGLVSAVAGAVATATAKDPADRILGIIPAGRGNDFARWLGINRANAIDVLLASKTRDVDLGRVNGRPFTCIASLGFDSLVLETAEKVRLVRGSLVYPYATLKALLRWRSADFVVEIDGNRQQFKGYSVVVANSGSYGGGMRIAPDASLDDGVFDVVTIDSVNFIRFLVQASRVFKGRHVSSRAVHVSRGSSVTVNSDRPFNLYADGELVGQSPVSMSVDAGVLRVVAP